MSKRKSTSTPAHSTTNANAAAGAANESYDSDNGFVVDDDDGAPRGKKVKVGHGAEKGGKKEGGKKEGGKKGDVKNEGGKKGDMKGKGRGDGIGIGGGGAQVGKDGECFWEVCEMPSSWLDGYGCGEVWWEGMRRELCEGWMKGNHVGGDIGGHWGI